MARKSEIEKLADSLIDAPWWMSIVAGGVAYVLLSVIFPSVMAGSPVLSGLVLLSKGVAPLAFFFFCFIGLLAFFKGRRKTGLVAQGNKIDHRHNLSSMQFEADGGSATVGVPPDGWSFTGIEESKIPGWSLEVLTSLEWKRFETVCTEYLKAIGHDAQETRIGADGGVDIVVHGNGQEKPIAVVQCKAWNTYKVGVKPIRELFGLMAAEHVTNGMFITSGDFTSEALSFAEGKRLRLINGDKLLKAIKKLPEEKQSQLLSIALEGNYTTPTCPRCGIKMTIRTSRKGTDIARKFWGCVNYPRCRSTLVYKV